MTTLYLPCNVMMSYFIQVDPEALFTLLLNLEKETEDTLDILELVEGDKPLEALVCPEWDFLLII